LTTVNTTAAQSTSTTTRTDDHRNVWVSLISHPIVGLPFGVFSLGAWTWATLTQITTSENFALLSGYDQTPAQAAALLHQYSVIAQIGSIIQLSYYNLPQPLIAASSYALLVEFFTLIGAFGYSYLQQIVFRKVSKTASVNTRVANESVIRDYIFLIGMGALILFNSIADYSYGPGNGYVHILMAGAVALTSVFALPFAILCFLGSAGQFRSGR
jgi:hypothetical protein